MENLVSVIIPTYNRSLLILRAINSVLKQTYKNFELLIIDDGSTDDTYSQLGNLIESNLITYIKMTNSGVSAARNKGILNAKGAFIAFLDSDDEWLPNKLEIQIKYLSDNANMNIAFTDEIWIRNNFRVNQKKIHQKVGGFIFQNCVKQCFIAPSSIILRKSVLDEVIGFDESFEICEDYDLWLRLSSIYEIGYIPLALIIKYGGHDDQLSTKFYAMDFWRIKSLLNIVKIRELSKEDHGCALEFIKDRGEILLNGYKKHGNEVNYQKILEILNSIK